MDTLGIVVVSRVRPSAYAVRKPLGGLATLARRADRHPSAQ
jgi:hypothetical protein